MGKENITGSLNLLCTGTTLKGDIESEGDLRVDGNVNGNLTISGRAVIGPTAHISGDIKADEVDVLGVVTGNISAASLISLRKDGTIIGDIVADKVLIEVGGTFNGRATMGQGN